MHSQEMSAEEIVRRGKEIYGRLKATLEPGHQGEFVVINVENGDYTLAPTTTEAGARMRAKYPDQVFFEVCVGSECVTRWSTPMVPDAVRTH